MFQRVQMIQSIWPEPNASASGVRTWQWIRFFERWGSKVQVLSPGNASPGLEILKSQGIDTANLPLNHPAAVNEILNFHPDLVLFDRFITEEQFGFQFQRHAPQALRLLETQDLHFLRKSRQGGNQDPLNQDRLRELSSIARSDLTTLVSSFEETLLHSQFGFNADQVRWVPFLYEDPILDSKNWQTVYPEPVLLWVGNFRHAPNRDGLIWFLKKVLPRIVIRLPQVRMRIGGAFPSKEIKELCSQFKSIQFVDQVENLDSFFQGRVNLAPLQFGAGIKGKIMEGWRRGVPCVATSIGAEGYSRVRSFGGIVADSEQEFADACIALLTQDSTWLPARDAGRKIMLEDQNISVHEESLRTWMLRARDQLQQRRDSNWVGRALEMSLNRSTEYFSKWIQEKSRS